MSPTPRRLRILGDCLVLVVLLAGLPGSAVASAERWRPPPQALAAIDPHDPWGTWGYQDFSGLCLLGCQRYPYENWTKPDPYVLGEDRANRIVVVQDRANRLVVRRFGSLTGKALKRDAIPYPRGWEYGGFHFGADGSWFLLLGRSNQHERNSRAVIKVRRYDDRLRLMGEAVVHGRDAHTYEPFVAGAASFVSDESTLFVLLSHLGFADDQGLNHQWSWVLRVELEGMHASVPVQQSAGHSFSQFARRRDDDLVLLNHGDAYPRAVAISQGRDAFSGAAADAGWNDRQTAFRLKGKTGDNFTGTTVNGFEVGTSSALATGVSVPHGNQVRGVTGRKRSFRPNAYLTSTDLATGATRFRWMTTFSPTKGSALVGQPRLITVAPDRFAVLYNVSRGRSDPVTDYYLHSNTLVYRLVNQRGRTLATRAFKGVRFIPLSQPVVRRRAVVWAGLFRTSGDPPNGGVHLTGLDISDPRAPKLLHR